MDKKLADVFSNLSDEEIIEISDIELDCQMDEITLKRIKAASFQRVGLSNEEKKREGIVKSSNTWNKVAILAVCTTIVLSILATTGFSQFLSGFWTSKVTIGDGKEEIIVNKEVGLIHINEDAPKKDLVDISLKQAEDIIGINFLHSAMYSNQTVKYMPIIPHKEIEALDLWYPFCVVYDSDDNDKNICGSFWLLTDKATEHVIPNEDIDASGEKILLRSYNSSNLNTTVILYTNDWSQERLTAVFDYMNVHYTFTGNKVSEEEMMEFIKSLT